MITLQHSLITLIEEFRKNKEMLEIGLETKENIVNKFKEEIPYVLLPDAIRMYTGPRPYSHFEESSKGEEISWMEFPTNIKDFSKEKFETMDKFISNDIKPCCIGETTHIETYMEHNEHLPELYFDGVLKHLIQDANFDDFIRKMIDCTDKYDDKFFYDGKELDGKEVRKLIADIEMFGVYVLAKEVYEKYEITANQNWFDENVKTELDKMYSNEMSENTYKYMQIDEKINEYITNHDFTHIKDGIVSEKTIFDLYDVVIEEMTEKTKHEHITEKDNNER